MVPFNWYCLIQFFSTTSAKVPRELRQCYTVTWKHYRVLIGQIESSPACQQLSTAAHLLLPKNYLKVWHAIYIINHIYLIYAHRSYTVCMTNVYTRMISSCEYGFKDQFLFLPWLELSSVEIVMITPKRYSNPSQLEACWKLTQCNYHSMLLTCEWLWTNLSAKSMPFNK